MSMFAPSSPTSNMQTRSAARTRYNSDTPSTKQHSSSYPTIDPALNNHTSTPTRARDHKDSASAVLSPDPTTTTSSLSALSSASPHEGYGALHTPFVQHAAPPSVSGTPQQGSNPSNDQRRQQASPSQMPGFHHDSPSPPVTYGINANLIVGGGDAPNMSHAVAGPLCQPLVPGQTDVFMSGKAGTPTPRPVLRSTLSLNAIPTPTSAASSWSRRNVSDEIANGSSGTAVSAPRVPAPPVSTESAVLGTYPPDTPLSQQGSIHEASAPFSHPSHPAATHTHGQSSSYPSHHHSSSHHMSATAAPYSDQEHSFQSSTYAGSYDSSYSSASPWTPQSSSEYHQYHHPYYSHSMSNKIEEPILAPGEVPAPRPPMSYAALIGEALLMAPPPHQLYVSEISDSIKRRYPYYRQNPTKVYNGVRHQTSMCKAFVKLPRPFGDQSGGARKWAIRAGCETWFAGGGYHPPGSNAAASMKKASSPPSASSGKAKQTARSKQLAIGTSSSHSPKMSSASSKVKSEPYLPASMGGGPSVGPAFDGTSKPYYPPYGHSAVPYQHYAPQSSQAAPTGYYPGHGHYYVPIHAGYSQQPQSQSGSAQPYWNTYGSNGQQAHGSPDTSPQMPPSATYPPAYGSSYGAYPQPGQYAQPNDGKMYGSMSMPHHPGYPQSSERPDTQGSQGSPASYEGKPSPNGRDRDNSAELSPRH